MAGFDSKVRNRLLCKEFSTQPGDQLNILLYQFICCYSHGLSPPWESYYRAVCSLSLIPLRGSGWVVRNRPRCQHGTSRPGSQITAGGSTRKREDAKGK